MNYMTQRGRQDNIVAFEHICDTIEDLEKIEPKYITLGSVAIVLQGTMGVEIYMATSDKQWIMLV